MSSPRMIYVFLHPPRTCMGFTQTIHNTAIMSKKGPLVGSPCPRCHAGMYTPGRSLSMHLAMHCPAALLWDTLSGQTHDRKRTHFQMVNDSTTDTFANMSKRFNFVPDQLPITTRNPLMSQPSLAALAATREDQNNMLCGYQVQEALVEFDNSPDELPLTLHTLAPTVTNSTATVTKQNNRKFRDS